MVKPVFLSTTEQFSSYTSIFFGCYVELLKVGRVVVSGELISSNCVSVLLVKSTRNLKILIFLLIDLICKLYDADFIDRYFLHAAVKNKRNKKFIAFVLKRK